VYILASIRRVLYVGMTSDVEKRIDEHWFKAHPRSFSAQYQCNRLVHFEEYSEVTDAIVREKQLKSWRRAKKVGLIESFNPEWRDLSYRNAWR
jgi:putative endonuclease